MIELASKNLSEIAALFLEMGLPAFRAKQVFSWIHKAADFDEMTNLPKELREKLKETCVANPVRILETHKSQIDDTVKFLFGLADGNCVEGVLMRYRHGATFCLSTQVGCRMGCKFCASTLNGKVRDLTPGEMLGQILCANRFMADEGHVHNIVLMGSGEPLDNYGNVMAFLWLLKEPEGICISLRNVSLSTCGLVPEMLRLAKEKLPVTLCVSLHAPNDEIRRQTMPIANRYPMQDVIAACRNYIRETGRRVIFEYALVRGVNDSKENALELAQKLRGMQCHVNLIPLNEVKESSFKTVSEKTVSQFQETLEKCRISCTRRREMGDDIEGACGQLRRKTLNEGSAEDEGGL